MCQSLNPKIWLHLHDFPFLTFLAAQGLIIAPSPQWVRQPGQYCLKTQICPLVVGACYNMRLQARASTCRGPRETRRERKEKWNNQKKKKNPHTKIPQTSSRDKLSMLSGSCAFQMCVCKQAEWDRGVCDGLLLSRSGNETVGTRDAGWAPVAWQKGWKRDSEVDPGTTSPYRDAANTAVLSASERYHCMPYTEIDR